MNMHNFFCTVKLTVQIASWKCSLKTRRNGLYEPMAWTYHQQKCEANSSNIVNFRKAWKGPNRAPSSWELINVSKKPPLYQQQHQGKTKRTTEIVEEVSNLLGEDSILTIRKADSQLSLSTKTLWTAKFYHPTTVQPLTAFHIQQRLEFSCWFLAQEEGFEQGVVWTDENFFVLRHRPNRKNDGIWSRSNPHDIVETYDRNGTKVMLSVAIVDGKIPIVHAFIDHTGRTVSVNGACYLAFLKEVMWPVFRTTATRKWLWWMQDGASPHWTNDAKNFLLEKFHERVISKGTNVIWPGHSPQAYGGHFQQHIQ